MSVVLLETGVGSETSIPVDHKFLLSQMKATIWKCLNFNACQCEIVLIPRSPLKSSFVVASSNQEIRHIDTDESNKLSTIHEHEGTLIQLLNLSSFCQVTKKLFSTKLLRVSETVHRSSNFNICSAICHASLVEALHTHLVLPLHDHQTEKLSSRHPFSSENHATQGAVKRVVSKGD